MSTGETFTKVGERAGAAVDSGVHTARQHARTLHKRARRAGDTAQAALAERAAQAQETLAERVAQAQETLAERVAQAQEALAERLNEARHELAVRIEPAPRPRRRWPWLVLLLAVAAGAVGAAILARRPRETDPESEELPPHPGREPGSRDSDPDAGWNAPTGNGVIGAQRPSANAD